MGDVVDGFVGVIDAVDIMLWMRCRVLSCAGVGAI